MEVNLKQWLLLGLYFMTYTVVKSWRSTNEQSLCYTSNYKKNLYDFTYPNIHKKLLDFRKYKGSVVLVVNVASFWGLTFVTYTQLNALVERYAFVNGKCSLKVLGFPCNQFGHQEPGTNPEILNCLEYVRPGNNYKPNFDLFSKLDVNGKNEATLFRWLKESCPRPTPFISSSPITLWSPIKTTDIQWNFEKFLINENGVPIRRYSSNTLPNTFTDDVGETIKKCLKETY